MKCRTILSISVMLSILLSFNATVGAQQDARIFRFDSGVVTLNNPDQFMRVTIDWGDGRDAVVRFRQLGYIEQGNIYKVVSEVTTDPITLAAGDAAHFDINQNGFGAVRGVLYVGGAGGVAANGRVIVQIISRSTGRVESFMPALLIP